jgi:hypothetical protein
MAITIQEILGTDSISGSRLTINSNFLILENAYNNLEDVFNINVLTGSMDVSSASGGQIKAKSLLSNSLVMPSAGSPQVQLYGTGASAGYGIFSNTVASATGTFSNVLQTNAFSATGASSFGATGTFNAPIISNNSLRIGPSGNFITENRKASVGATTAFPSAPGAAVTGTYSNPYVPTLTENVIYINSLAVDSTFTGFYMKVAANGSTVPSIPAGFMLTLIDTATVAGTGKIACGITGGTNYYTGFSSSTSKGLGVTTISIAVSNAKPYSTSITLMWEPRLGASETSQKGSWVIVNRTGNVTL